MGDKMQELDRVRIIATGMTGTIVDIFGKEEKEYIIEMDEFDDKGEKIFNCLNDEIEPLGDKDV